MTAPHRIEQHDGRRWVLLCQTACVKDASRWFKWFPMSRPIRIVEAESRRIVALHDPRHGYAYPETTT